jgi:hypothetical protein
MNEFSRLLVFLQTIPAIAHAKTTAVIPANLAASYLGKYVTAERRCRQGVHFQA